MLKKYEQISSKILSYEHVSEEAHFDKISFRIQKKIFATYDPKLHRFCIKLNEIDKSVFCAFDSTLIYPVQNKWGKQGWTIFELSKINKLMMLDAINCAYHDLLNSKSIKKNKPRNTIS